MTPPAAAAPARTRTRRHAPPPRRVSGPVRGRGRAAAPSPPPLALRLGGAVHGLAEHRLLDRIARGRAWIGIVAVGLIGIVFMQVSMLRMNAGIGQAVERATVLQRQNAAVRATISELSSGERIAAEAARLGLVAPATTPRFLDARGADVRRALSSMTPPGEGIVPSATSLQDAATATAPAVAAPATPLVQTGVAAAPQPAAPAAAPEATAPPAAAAHAPPAAGPPSDSQPAVAPAGTAGTGADVPDAHG